MQKKRIPTVTGIISGLRGMPGCLRGGAPVSADKPNLGALGADLLDLLRRGFFRHENLAGHPRSGAVRGYGASGIAG